MKIVQHWPADAPASSTEASAVVVVISAIVVHSHHDGGANVGSGRGGNQLGPTGDS